MSNIEKRNPSQPPETTADRISDVMIFSGIAVGVVPIIALLPLITTWMIVLMLIGGGVALGAVKNFGK